MVGTGQIQVSHKVYNSKYKMGGPTRAYMQDTDSFWDRQKQQPWSVESSKKVPNGEVRTK